MTTPGEGVGSGARERPFAVALVGCGGVAAMHLEGYARHPERVQVVAACDVDAGRAVATAGRWGIPATFTSLAAMLDRAEWEVAVVCTPTPVREAVVSELAAAGKHLFVEKPLADSLDEARRIVAACERAGAHLAVDQNFRYHYPFDLAREWVGVGRLGKVVGISHHDLFFRQDRGWRTGCSRYALSVMGIHWLDGFRWALQSEARSIMCRTHSSPAIQCEGETDAFLQIAFANGATAAYVQSFSAPVARTETLILGEEGMLALDYHGAAFYRREADPLPVDSRARPDAGVDKPEATYRSLDHLLASIETGQAPSNSGRDNLRSIALLDAAYRSAAEGRPVVLADAVQP
jgi:predicted dehydrogenase